MPPLEPAGPETFGGRLARLRSARGVTQRWLAREVGMSDASVPSYETGGTTPSAEALDRLAEVFGVTMHELWLGVGRCEPGWAPDTEAPGDDQ